MHQLHLSRITHHACRAEAMQRRASRANALLFLILLAQPSLLHSEPASAVNDLNTPRQFPTISSRPEWQARAKEIREQILVSCGLWPLPEKTALHAHVFGKIERDGYSVEKVYLQTLPGF